MRRISPIALLLCSLCALPAAADTITVDLNGTGDFIEVAPAVDAASAGDTVLVLPGYYQGAGSRNIDFNGKDIVLKSRDGHESTWLDPYSGFYNVLVFHNGETRNAVVEGLTITRATQGALICDGASPTIRSCRFTHNRTNTWSQMHTRSCAVGGARYSSLLIEDCVFDNNRAENVISTMYFVLCQGATIRGCRFRNNTEEPGNMYNDPSGVIAFWGSDDTVIEECHFVNNDSNNSCIHFTGTADVDILNCTLEGNVASSSFAPWGLIHLANSGSAEISDCTVSANLNADSCVSVTGAANVFIDGCTFVGNGSAPCCDADEVISVDTASRGVISVSNSVLAFNDCLVPIACDGILPTISACCFYETGDPDSMCAPYDPETLLLEDPLFCGFASGDFSLCADSPCLPGNNDWSVQIGAHGEGCGPCGTPVEHTSWGSIKAMFR